MPKEGIATVYPILLNDIKERAEIGRVRYGRYLEVNNGRCNLTDAYQEALDLSMYLCAWRTQWAELLNLLDLEETATIEDVTNTIKELL
jgi:hypothetical protein